MENDPLSPGGKSGPPNTHRGRPKDPVRRGEIVRAARALFLEHGVAAVSMDGIAQAAGVSKKTIYSHFANKEELLIEVIFTEAAQFQIPDPDLQSVGDFHQLRRQLIELGVKFVSMLSLPGIVDLGNLLIAESRRHPGIIQQFMKYGPEDKHAKLAAYLKKADAAGLLDIPEPEVSSDQLFALWQGMWHLKQQMGLAGPPSPDWIQSHCTKAVDLFLRGNQVGKDDRGVKDRD